jgi:hypothetical protein
MATAISNAAILSGRPKTMMPNPDAMGPPQARPGRPMFGFGELGEGMPRHAQGTLSGTALLQTGHRALSPSRRRRQLSTTTPTAKKKCLGFAKSELLPAYAPGPPCLCRPITGCAMPAWEKKKKKKRKENLICDASRARFQAGVRGRAHGVAVVHGPGGDMSFRSPGPGFRRSRFQLQRGGASEVRRMGGKGWICPAVWVHSSSIITGFVRWEWRRDGLSSYRNCRCHGGGGGDGDGVVRCGIVAAAAGSFAIASSLPWFLERNLWD